MFSSGATTIQLRYNKRVCAFDVTNSVLARFSFDHQRCIGCALGERIEDFG